MFRTLLFTSALMLSACSGSRADGTFQRDQIQVVGSSTVFPFSTSAAENFGRSTAFRTPIVQSTGSGGGLQQFCAGTGPTTPDLANASRRIKSSEVELCARNGVDEIVEIVLGFDGIVLANSREAEPINLSLRDVFLALARDIPDGKGGFVENPYRKWSDIREGLPERVIRVLGPPPTSGTRDAFVELAMEGGCKTFPQLQALKKESSDAFKARCHTVREDDAFVEAGENDNLIIQKLLTDPNGFGIFGYSFLEQNGDRIQAARIDGVEPTFKDIASGDYPVARSLYVYLKPDHVERVPGLREFARELTSDRAAGQMGYLADKGLIPLPDANREEVAAGVETLRAMDLARPSLSERNMGERG